MKINRRIFLMTGALGGAASVIGSQTESVRGVERFDGSSTIKEPKVITRRCKDTGTIPNSRLPVLIYQDALELAKEDPAAGIETLLRANQWGNDWRNGIFTYHHYHSTAHEALFVFSGSAKVQLGGEGGFIETIKMGDVIIIPAGVGHKNLGASGDFHVVGAYPPQQNVDMNYGKPGERPRADENISRVPTPVTDPVFGKAGPLLDHWRAKGGGVG
jgi:uncharacterized protein YjlB